MASAISIKRLIKALRYSLLGLKSIFYSEPSFRLEVYLSILLIPLALMLKATAIEKAVLIGSWLLVLIIEAINSAIETVVDRIGLDIHHLSKKAKDIGSAAVFLAIINASITWMLVLL